MIDRDKLEEIGTFTRPHGLKGEIAAHIDFEIMPLLDDFGHVFVEIDGLLVPFSLISCRPKGSETMLLTLKGIDSQDLAANLTNLPIYIESDLLPDDGFDDGENFYLEDLVGFTLMAGDDRVGLISGYDDSTDNLLFEVNRSGDTILIPASADFVEEIDTEAHLVVMNLPEGLLDL